MIQEAFTYVGEISDVDIKLKLIDTLITVTSGKVSIVLFMILVGYMKTVMSLMTNNLSLYISRYMWRSREPGSLEY